MALSSVSWVYGGLLSADGRVVTVRGVPDIRMLKVLLLYLQLDVAGSVCAPIQWALMAVMVLESMVDYNGSVSARSAIWQVVRQDQLLRRHEGQNDYSLRNIEHAHAA